MEFFRNHLWKRRNKDGEKNTAITEWIVNYKSCISYRVLYITFVLQSVDKKKKITWFKADPTFKYQKGQSEGSG